ncbi:MAG TPA: EipA family protein [Caulobacteraceae bacterium]|nr:EipA family protein [Caulobacteraceae bacterium]
MDRRLLILSGLAAAAGGKALAQGDRPEPSRPSEPPRPSGPDDAPAESYSDSEIVNGVSDFFGVTAEDAGTLIERIFRANGRPTAYIAGTEGSAAFFFGLRYGEGLLYMKGRPRLKVYWQGPTGGFDWGADGARVFTLCYNLQYPDAIFRRFPGVDGSAYLIGGMGFNYQRAEDITLVPIRAGGGLRLGASIGYLAYSRQRNLIPL